MAKVLCQPCCNLRLRLKLVTSLKKIQFDSEVKIFQDFSDRVKMRFLFHDPHLWFSILFRAQVDFYGTDLDLRWNFCRLSYLSSKDFSYNMDVMMWQTSKISPLNNLVFCSNTPNLKHMFWNTSKYSIFLIHSKFAR